MGRSSCSGAMAGAVRPHPATPSPVPLSPCASRSTGIKRLTHHCSKFTSKHVCMHSTRVADSHLPDSRYIYIYIYIYNSIFILHELSGVTNDLFAFDTTTLLWTGLSPAAPPSPRAYHGFAAAGGRLFVFAGQGPAGPHAAREVLGACCPTSMRGWRQGQNRGSDV